MHDKITANGAWSGPGAEFLNFGTACIYLDGIKLDTSNFANSYNVASISQRMSRCLFALFFPTAYYLHVCFVGHAA